MRPTHRHSAGFTLIELIIVVGLMMLMGMFALDRDRMERANTQGKSLGASTKMLGDAVGLYIRKNIVALSGAAHTDLTVADLKAGEHLDNNFPEMTSLGNGWKIRIRRNGTGTPYRFDALVISDRAITDTEGNPRFDVLGHALQAYGSPMGMTYNTNSTEVRHGDVLATLDGTGFGAWPWTPAFTPSVSGGHIAYYVNGANDMDSTYLRIDGGNSMIGNLNFTTGAITNPTSITAIGDITTNDGNINAPSTTAGRGMVIAQSDVQIGSLATRSSGATSTSLKAISPKLTELNAVVVSHGSSVAKPTCETGGTPAIFIVPQNTMGNVDAATWGYNMLARDNGANWGIEMTQQDGTSPLPLGRDPYTGAPGYTQQAVARIFCSY